jgi:hypothetical protein
MPLKVFLDTNILLKGFGAFRSQQALSAYFTVSSVERYTFEKCVFEVYRLFRGVVGKKPSEGRGRWAEQNLKAKTDPSPIGKLLSQVRSGDSDVDRGFARFWINQILEAGDELDERERIIEEHVRPEDRDATRAEIVKQRQLMDEKQKFSRLCNGFGDFLEKYAITVSSYASVFDATRSMEFASVHPAMLDSFVRDTLIPNEDFEIVFAALSLPTDVFVTDDADLITASWSLGLNFPLSRDSFCKGDDYFSNARKD